MGFNPQRPGTTRDAGTIQVSLNPILSDCLDRTSSVGPVYCSWDPQVPFFKKTILKVKTGFHGTIHIFKNYFATVFSVFNFQQ